MGTQDAQKHAHLYKFLLGNLPLFLNQISSSLEYTLTDGQRIQEMFFVDANANIKITKMHFNNSK